MTTQPELPAIIEPNSFDQDVPFQDFQRIVREQEQRGFKAIAKTKRSREFWAKKFFGVAYESGGMLRPLH